MWHNGNRLVVVSLHKHNYNRSVAGYTSFSAGITCPISAIHARNWGCGGWDRVYTTNENDNPYGGYYLQGPLAQLPHLVQTEIDAITQAIITLVSFSPLELKERILNSEKFSNYRYSSPVSDEILRKFNDIESLVDISMHHAPDLDDLADIPIITEIVDVMSKYMGYP